MPFFAEGAPGKGYVQKEKPENPALATARVRLKLINFCARSHVTVRVTVTGVALRWQGLEASRNIDESAMLEVSDKQVGDFLCALI